MEKRVLKEAEVKQLSALKKAVIEAEDKAKKEGTDEAKKYLESSKTDLFEYQCKLAKLGAFTPKKGDEKYYHVELEQVRFDANTGERLSKPVVQPLDESEFATISNSAPQLGYKTTLVWDASVFTL